MVLLEGLGKLKKSTSSGTRTGDFPACSILPQPTTLRAPRHDSIVEIICVPFRACEKQRKLFALLWNLHFPLRVSSHCALAVEMTSR
jgi:hypothetical protein